VRTSTAGTHDIESGGSTESAAVHGAHLVATIDRVHGHVDEASDSSRPQEGVGSHADEAEFYDRDDHVGGRRIDGVHAHDIGSLAGALPLLESEEPT
jgi:hypothetical protein